MVTDNDGDIEAIEKKYENYLDENAKEFIMICYDSEIDECPEIDEKFFNCNTMEPKLVKANSLEKMSEVLDKDFEDLIALHKFMKGNKTDCALKIFKFEGEVSYPQYILDAIADE